MMLAVEQISVDYVVVGAGVAGLRAAIGLAHGGNVLVLAKGAVTESATAVAQGGIAAALSDEDKISLHEQDTIRAGDGLCNPEAVRILVEEGPHYIHELITWGTEFDRTGTKLSFTREGAHSRSRILHANGDSTGWEIFRALLARARTLPSLTVRPRSFTTELVTSAEGQVTGLQFLDEASQQLVRVDCRAVLLATGGLGQMYPETTNPATATGDGMAIGYRAGAALADMEFIQFHPTALSVKAAPPFLLSEALRGEGAVLRNALLKRFMPHYHESAELAPRDVVSRAIVAEMKRTRMPYVYLDLTGLNADFLRKRFPRIYSTCLNYGIDITADMVPVRPAAHYAMGGLKTDFHGRTTLARLYAAGETASTGVHGANRLASNSLLEGLVFGARTGEAMLADTPQGKSATMHSPTGHAAKRAPASKRGAKCGPAKSGRSAARTTAPPTRAKTPADPPDPTLEGIRKILGEQVGILREGRELKEAAEKLASMRVPRPETLSRRAWEIHNMWTLAQVVTRCALAREESRGSHYRSDFPYRDDEQFGKHSILCREGGVRFE
jgi:L-aspartate oxidase